MTDDGGILTPFYKKICWSAGRFGLSLDGFSCSLPSSSTTPGFSASMAGMIQTAHAGITTVWACLIGAWVAGRWISVKYMGMLLETSEHHLLIVYQWCFHSLVYVKLINGFDCQLIGHRSPLEQSLCMHCASNLCLLLLSLQHCWIELETLPTELISSCYPSHGGLASSDPSLLPLLLPNQYWSHNLGQLRNLVSMSRLPNISLPQLQYQMRYSHLHTIQHPLLCQFPEGAGLITVWWGPLSIWDLILLLLEEIDMPEKIRMTAQNVV